MVSLADARFRGPFCRKLARLHPHELARHDPQGLFSRKMTLRLGAVRTMSAVLLRVFHQRLRWCAAGLLLVATGLAGGTTVLAAARLGVLPREVGDAGGGWAADAGVVAVMVVVVEPCGQGGAPVGF